VASEDLQVERDSAAADGAGPVAPTAPVANGVTAGSGPEPEGAPRPKRSLPMALLVEARPKQWVKNVLVFAAPGAASVLTQPKALLQAVIAFCAFSLAAAGTYYLNDAGDVEADRLHPKKRYRPIAAGEIPVPLARVLGVAFVLGGIALSFAAHWQLAVVVAAYVVLTTSYTLWLKHMVLFDVVAVAAGFVLRAIGGAAATHVVVSPWFFIVATFGSLFMVAGKRHAEIRTTGEQAGAIRATLGEYSESYLEYLRSVSTSATLVAYCLWAFEKASEKGHHTPVPLFELSIVPFSLAILRYALLVDQGQGGAPEEVIFGDRVIQVIGLVWLVVFGLGLHFK